MKKLLVIGRTFPEPSTTAAGGHMMDLLQIFQDEGYQIIFSSTASLSERSAKLEDLNIEMKSILLNDPSFDILLKEYEPNVVLFDRFITEEQFGWRIHEVLPNCLKILDTEDLHFLRRARAEACKNELVFTEEMLFTEAAKRELASILRCDLSLIISEFELNLLTNTFSIPKELLMYLPILVDSTNKTNKPSFEDRSHFISVGNFHHAPNLDAVKYLKQEIWHLIRKELPHAELHVYGAYAPEQIKQMHKAEEGFIIKGWAENLAEVMSIARVCLAPIRFGAGLKGKLMDAMIYRTPMVTTPVGVEGMYGKYQVPGIVAGDAKNLANAAVELYTNKEKWESVLVDVPRILSERFNKEAFRDEFVARLRDLRDDLKQHRKEHFIGQILQHQSLQSTKYMSKWIEEKNTLGDGV